MKSTALMLIVVLLGACGTSNQNEDEPSDFINHLTDRQDFERYATEDGVLKYLVNLPNQQDAVLGERCYFQNTNRFSWHFNFLRSFPEYEALDFRTYQSWILYRSNRKFFAGGLAWHEKVKHPQSQSEGIYTFSLYAAPAQSHVDDVKATLSDLQKCAPLVAKKLVFVPEGTEQKAWAKSNLEAIKQAQIPILFPADIGPKEPTIYSEGEGYGTLRVIPKGETLDDYGPLDIVVTESAPNDISIVQGLITKDPQNELSHANLRLLEKRTPNLSLPTAYDDARIIDLKDKLIHLVAKKGEALTIEAASLEDAKRFWDSRRPQLPEIESDLTVTKLESFDDLQHGNAIAYGSKAANLGELYSILPEDNRNPGFAIPFSAYVAFIQTHNIQSEIESLLADPMLRNDADFKRTSLKALRKRIKKASVDEAFLRAIESQIVATFGEEFKTKRIRFRSSTNIEDLDEISGAGLYDSKSGCIADDFDGDDEGPSLCLSDEERTQKETQLAARKAELEAHPDRTYLVDIIDDIEGDLTKEKPVGKAIAKVWASLWNERAFDEREYYGIDHAKAFMGIAVNPSFVLEKASAVALTHLKRDDGLPLYKINTQVGDESVVRPDDPTAVAEVMTFRRDTKRWTDKKLLVRSSLLPQGEDVWTDEQITTMAALLFAAHDHFSTQVYSHLENVSLDIEFKLTADDKIVLKQARPFLTR